MRKLLIKKTLLLAIAFVAVGLFSSTAFAGDSISSAANQVFAKSQISTAISTITVTNTDDDMSIGNSVLIRIPVTSNFKWDDSDTIAVLTDGAGAPVAAGSFTNSVGGAACSASPCSVTVSYVAGGGTDLILVIPVRAENFDPGDVFTVSGLSFETFSAESSDNLELCTDGTCGATEATDDKTVKIGAPAIVSAASQAFAKNQIDTAISAITITESATTPVINATDDIRITIPTGMFVWDSADTSITLTDGTGAPLADGGKIAGCSASPCTVTLNGTNFEDSNRTLLITVDGALATGDSFTISGINYKTFTSAHVNDNLDLDVANDDTYAGTDTATIGVGAPTIASAASQIFVKNQAATAISAITITEAAVPVINATDDIRITIPAGFIWDSADTTLILTDSTGTPLADGGKVGGCSASPCTVTLASGNFEDSARTLVITVDGALAAGDAFVVSGINYKTFSAATASDNLDLEVANDATIVSTDTSTIVEGAPTIASSASQNFYVNMASQPLDWTITIAESATAPGINQTDDIIIRIPTAFNMQFDPSDTTVVVAGTNWAKVEQTEGGDACAATSCAVTVVIKQADASTACTGAAGSLCKTLRIPVDANWAASNSVTVTGALLFGFDALSDADNLELEAAGTGYGSSPTALDSATVTVLANSSDDTGDGDTLDTTPPAVPTSLKATVGTDLKVALTWDDPINTDFVSAKIYKVKNSEAETLLTTVVIGGEQYTDGAVSAGDTVKYAIASVDASGNVSAKSAYAQVEIEAGETDQVEVPGAEDEEEEVVVPPDTEETVTLTDVATHWSKDVVEAMVEKGIVTGYDDGTFKPDNNLNRAEAAALLYRVLGLAEPVAPTLAPFSDVSDLTSWFAGYVAHLKAESLISGYDDGTFKPAALINRAEFLKLAMNVYKYLISPDTKATVEGYETGTMTDAYVDLKATDWFAPTVTAATEMGFIGGKDCTGGKCFDAGANITRAEATKILYNMFFTML